MDATDLPIVEFDSSGNALGRWWSKEPNGRILCQLCPRECHLKPGDRGFCFVRTNRDGAMVLDTYGRSTGFCIDPIEKKPLNHFLPGTPVLSFGTAGCNLGCKFCQNWDISKSREVARLSDKATPVDIARAASSHGCRSVAFTYNDPVIWAEYAIDTAAACHAENIKTVAVTAGYITPQARGEFFDAMDAANIDLKAFTEKFYHQITGAHLDPILDTIRYVCRETDCWVELTNLIIPDANDDEDQLQKMCDWVLEAVGADVPVHFTAFHPDFRMTDRPRTPHETLLKAYDLAKAAGLRYVYVGNVHDVARQSTYCPSCSQLLIERDWHQLGRYALDGNRCRHCQFEVAGQFETQPGNWGQRRQPIRINSEAQPSAQQPQEESAMQETTPTQDLQGAFDQQELEAIHLAASQFVAAVVNDQLVDTSELLGALAGRAVAGMYVTLKRGDTLRGCCGMQGPPIPLANALADAATRTAKHDPRMAPIAPLELPYLNLAISLLGPPRPIGVTGDQRIEAVQVGSHGLRIRMANKVGLLLPSVARERSWNSRQFLDAVCNKAGLPPGSWRSDDAHVEIFDGIDYGAPLAIDRPAAQSEPPLLDEQQLQRLCSWVGNNLVALQTGATPFYYATDVTDTTVQGVVLRVVYDESQPPASWMQLTIRDGVPLQSTLFQMTQTAAQTLASHGGADRWQVHVAILSTVIHHGLDTDADLEGIDVTRRALVAMDGRRWSIGFDAAADVDPLLRETISAQPFRSGGTMVYSTLCDCTEQSFSVSMGPQAQSAVSVRPSGVAGTFYPAEDNDRERLVDDLLSNLADVEKQPVAAAMVPHAGLHYSGKVAVDVWRRIELPESVLIIGPKHTADGVDWAVAPHDVWAISPTAKMSGDIDLARRIAESVPGMQLDSAAHAREHGIEVQLPLLYRLAPQTRIAAIAMSGGSYNELEKAAAALASCLSGLDKPPLLVISSDMNHFADDEENRRRDRLALAALQQNDPQGLLQVCADENISMCGQLPAALVLLTLKAMGRQADYTEIAYATSGDISGDLSRVVGYAGVLF
jgi:AmmeMemoRadiSam system radical SAM enzyme/AmmeMemoRadiSam system protein B/AmmeMemoRadiSam system protein A